jgi:hypothetical protein
MLCIAESRILFQLVLQFGTCSVKYKFRCLFLFAGICRGDFSSGLGPMYSYLKRNKIFTSTHLRLCVFEIIDGAKLRNSCYCVPWPTPRLSIDYDILFFLLLCERLKD